MATVIGTAGKDFIHSARDGRIAPAGYNDITGVTADLRPPEGDDVIKGLAGDDILIDDGGNDFLNGGPGADVLEGGGFFDFADYIDATG